MKFQKFLIRFVVPITIGVISLFLWLVGKGLGIIQSSLTAIVSTLIVMTCVPLGMELGDRIKKADADEIKREDDVLLEAVAFSQSVLFVLLSVMQSEDKLREALLYGTVTTTLAFYTLRAWAKIKDSPKYRYYSMIAFSFLSGNTITSALKLYFNIPDEFLLDMGLIYSSTAASLAYFAGKVFRKRYGHKS